MRYRKSTGELKSELGKVLVENRATSISSVRSNDDGGVVKKLRASHQLYLLNGTRVCRETFAAALDEPEDFIMPRHGTSAATTLHRHLTPHLCASAPSP
jgi:hypothetical protein